MSYHYLLLFVFTDTKFNVCQFVFILVMHRNSYDLEWLARDHISMALIDNVCSWTFVSVPNKNVIVLHHVLPSWDLCVAELLLRVRLMHTLWIREYLMRAESTWTLCLMEAEQYRAFTYHTSNSRMCVLESMEAQQYRAFIIRLTHANMWESMQFIKSRILYCKSFKNLYQVLQVMQPVSEHAMKSKICMM